MVTKAPALPLIATTVRLGCPIVCAILYLLLRSPKDAPHRMFIVRLVFLVALCGFFLFGQVDCNGLTARGHLRSRRRTGVQLSSLVLLKNFVKRHRLLADVIAVSATEGFDGFGFWEKFIAAAKFAAYAARYFHLVAVGVFLCPFQFHVACRTG